MLFLVVLQNFVVLHTKSAQQALFDVTEAGQHGPHEDGVININFADDNDAATGGLYFALDAEIIVSDTDQSGFTVKDLDGVAIQFNAYTPANLTTPYRVEYDDKQTERLYVTVGKFDVNLNHTDEGIIVDVWPKDTEGVYNGESLATLAVQNDEADEALEPDPDAKWDAENGQGPTG